LPIFQAEDAELCAVVAGIIVNLPPWRTFRFERMLLMGIQYSLLLNIFLLAAKFAMFLIFLAGKT
jgi:hypothetical protein